MTERDIRQAIRQICGELDLKARRAGWRRVAPALIPFAMGAGLVAGCDDETESRPGTGTDTGAQTAYGVPSGTPTALGGSGGTGGEGAAGGAGGGVAGAGGAGGAGDGGATMEYMAPDP